jgi:hypothetical protein
MNITVEQKGRSLIITVDFDSPDQVPIFNKYFEEMINKMASDYGAEVSSSDNAEYEYGTNIDDLMRSNFSQQKKSR